MFDQSRSLSRFVYGPALRHEADTRHYMGLARTTGGDPSFWVQCARAAWRLALRELRHAALVGSQAALADALHADWHARRVRTYISVGKYSLVNIPAQHGHTTREQAVAWLAQLEANRDRYFAIAAHYESLARR